MKINKQLIILFCIIYLLNLIGIIKIVQGTAYKYTVTRMLNEYKDESAYLCNLWTQYAGGGFYLKDGEIYTFNDEKLNEACKSWFEKWSENTNKNDDCSIIINDGNGYKRLYTSLIDSNGVSLQGSYIDNQTLIDMFDQNTSFSDYTGQLKIGGKTYMVSYSLLYQKNINSSPFICFVAEDLDLVKDKILDMTITYIHIIIVYSGVIFLIFYLALNLYINRSIKSKIKKATDDLFDTSKSIISNQDMLKITEHTYETQNSELREMIQDILNVTNKAISNTTINADTKEMIEIFDKNISDCETGKKDITRLITNQNNLIEDVNVLIEKINNNQIDNETLKTVLMNLNEEINSFKSLENKIKIVPTKLIDDLAYAKGYIDKINEYNDKILIEQSESENQLEYYKDKIKNNHLLEKPHTAYKDSLEFQLNNVDDAIQALNKI